MYDQGQSRVLSLKVKPIICIQIIKNFLRKWFFSDVLECLFGLKIPSGLSDAWTLYYLFDTCIHFLFNKFLMCGQNTKGKILPCANFLSFGFGLLFENFGFITAKRSLCLGCEQKWWFQCFTAPAMICRIFLKRYLKIVEMLKNDIILQSL